MIGEFLIAWSKIPYASQISEFLNHLCLKNNWVNHPNILHADMDQRKVESERRF